MLTRLSFCVCLALALPVVGCQEEEQGSAFSSGMSGAVKLSQCLGVSIDAVLNDTYAGSGEVYYGAPSAIQFFDNDVLGSGSLVSTDSAGRQAMIATLACMGAASGLRDGPCMCWAVGQLVWFQRCARV